jgi:hypothetical protein
VRIDYPGIGGSLGECIICGKCFALEVITGRSVPMIAIGGFGDRSLPLHQACKEKLTKGMAWEDLPEGPLRREYAEQLAPPVAEVTL